MKNLFSIISFALLAILTTRGSNLESIQATQDTLRPLKQTVTINNIEPYVDSIEIIQIEDTPSAPLGQITKILLDHSGNMYILGTNSATTILSADGSFVRQITQQECELGSCIGVEDVALSSDATEFMLINKGVIKCYGLDDSTSYRQIMIPSNIPYDAIAPASNGGVYLFAAFAADTNNERSSGPMVTKIDSSGNIVGQYIQREDIAFSINNITQVSHNNYILRPQNSRNEVLRLTPDSVEVVCYIDFNDKNIPANYYFDQANQDIMTYLSSPYYKLPMCFQQTDDLLYFKAGDDKTEHNFIIPTDGKSGINWNDAPSDRPSCQIMASDKDYLYVVVPRESILNYNSSTDQHGALHKFVLQHIVNNKQIDTDNNNPLIAKIKFKI